MDIGAVVDSNDNPPLPPLASKLLKLCWLPIGLVLLGMTLVQLIKWYAAPIYLLALFASIFQSFALFWFSMKTKQERQKLIWGGVLASIPMVFFIVSVIDIAINGMHM
ncbi:MAG: hypothetical protein R3270_09635 [Gammaproteobacteria bacterium]|nr:hypothetical protein [Gammaproteobacteria bacterium]